MLSSHGGTILCNVNAIFSSGMKNKARKSGWLELNNLNKKDMGYYVITGAYGNETLTRSSYFIIYLRHGPVSLNRQALLLI